MAVTTNDDVRESVLHHRFTTDPASDHNGLLEQLCEGWGTVRTVQFVLALNRFDEVEAKADDHPQGIAAYATEWLTAFIHLLRVAPRAFVESIPKSMIAAFLRAGAEALRDAGLAPDAVERGIAAAEVLDELEKDVADT